MGHRDRCPAPVQNGRAHQRFAIETELQYRGGRGPIRRGLMLNLSSRGAFFLARSHNLRVEDRIRLTIPLPTVGVQLIAASRVVRIEGDYVAVTFSRAWLSR